jgi:hypothetical protein
MTGFIFYDEVPATAPENGEFAQPFQQIVRFNSATPDIANLAAPSGQYAAAGKTVYFTKRFLKEG